MGPEALAQVLRPLAGMFAGADYPDLLRGLEAPDDAAVWRLDAGRALVLTSDFFPPVVDDPFEFGAIAAANAVSDVYAMGARPLLAINLVGFPDSLDPGILSEILRGGAETARRAGMVVAGGHTTSDPEPKYGMAVVGLVHPDRMWSNGGARPGDALLLTKALGTGFVTTALKRESVDAADLATAVAGMMRLHRGVVEALEPFRAAVHAATDVTGFALAGHAHELAHNSGCALRLRWPALPLLHGVQRYAEADCIPGGAQRNLEYYGRHVEGLDGLASWQRDVLFDPQTSGGLLLAVDGAATPAILAALEAADETVAVIGRVEAGQAGKLIIENDS